MLLNEGLELAVLEDVVVPLVDDRFLLVVDLASLGVDVLQIALVLEVQVPGHKHVLLFEFLLADALLALPLLLEGPDVDEALAADLGDAGELVDCPVADGLVGEVVDDCDGDEGVAGLRPQREVKTVCCE